MIQDQISELMKNNPFYKKFFIKLSLINKFDFEDYKRVFERLTQYSDIFKSEHFNVFEFDDLEKLEDEMVALIEKHQKVSFAKSFLSSKYYHLLSEDVYSIFQELKNKNIPREVIQGQFISKVAALKTPKSFLEGLVNFSQSVIDSSIEKIIKKSLQYNTRIILEDHINKKLAIEVLDYTACKALGSSSWCISYSSNIFKDYSNNDSNFISPFINKSNHIVIFYDFNLLTSNPMSMVGVTYNSTFSKVLYAYNKSDNSVSKEAYTLKEKPVFKLTNELVLNIASRKNMSVLDKKDFYVFLCAEKNNFDIVKDSDLFNNIFNFAKRHQFKELTYLLYIKSKMNLDSLLELEPSSEIMNVYFNLNKDSITFNDIDKITSFYSYKSASLLFKSIINNYNFNNSNDFIIIYNKCKGLITDQSIHMFIKFKMYNIINEYFKKIIKRNNIFQHLHIPEIKSIFEKHKDSIEITQLNQISLFINNGLISNEESFIEKINSYSFNSVLKDMVETNISESLFHLYIQRCLKDKNYEYYTSFFEALIKLCRKEGINPNIITYSKNYLSNMETINLGLIELLNGFLNKEELILLFSKNIYVEKSCFEAIKRYSRYLQNASIVFAHEYKLKLADPNFFTFNNYKIEFHHSLMNSKFKKLFDEKRVTLTQDSFDKHITKNPEIINDFFIYFDGNIKDFILNSNISYLQKIVHLINK